MRDPCQAFSAFIAMVVLIAIVLAPILIPYTPTEGEASNQFAPPSREHWLGTDQFGHDILSRLLTGGRNTLLGAALSTAVAMVLGLTIGAFGATFGGIVDWLLMRGIDVMLAFPSLLLALALVAAFGSGLWPVAFGIGISLSPGLARLVRAALLALKDAGFVEAARALGSGTPRVIWKHLVPNVLPRILPYSAVLFAWSLLNIAALEFLGLAGSPSTPSWGRMMNDGRTFLRVAPWIALSSGAAITLTTMVALRLSSPPRYRRDH